MYQRGRAGERESGRAGERESGRAGDEAKRHKSPAKSGRVGVTVIG